MIKQHPLPELFERFIRESRNGKRRKPNLTAIKPQSVANYSATFKLLHSFSHENNFPLFVMEVHGRNKREFNQAKKYWDNFYKKFTAYLYDKKGYYDNYVGFNIKNIRTFLNWLKMEKGFHLGEHYMKFYRPSEDIPLITLSPKQFRFLAFDKDFEASLSEPLKRTKDIFVFGCIVGLRFSDLMNLGWPNLVIKEGARYINTRSRKTETDTFTRLPDYALNIIDKQSRKRKKIFTTISLFRFNANLKSICEKAGWTQAVERLRVKRGTTRVTRNKNQHNTAYRFCDLASSHLMRRTAITNYLTMGMPEYLVRKISGHSPNSKSFHRYVNLSQEMIDRELEAAHQKLSEGVALQEVDQ